MMGVYLVVKGSGTFLLNRRHDDDDDDEGVMCGRN